MANVPKFIIKITKHPAFLSLPSRRRYEITVDDFCLFLQDLDDYEVSYTWPLPTIKSFRGLSQTNVSIVLSSIANGGPGEIVFMFLSPQEARDFYSWMCNEVLELRQAINEGIYTNNYKKYENYSERNDPLQNDPDLKYSASVGSDSESSESEEEEDQQIIYTPPGTTYDHELFWERQPVPPVDHYGAGRPHGLPMEARDRYHQKGPEGIHQIRHERHREEHRRDNYHGQMHQQQPVNRIMKEKHHDNDQRNIHHERKYVEGHRQYPPHVNHYEQEHAHQGRASYPDNSADQRIKNGSHPQPRSYSPYRDDRRPHGSKHGPHTKPRSHSPHGPHSKPRSHSPHSDERRQRRSRENYHPTVGPNSGEMGPTEAGYNGNEKYLSHRHARRRDVETIRMVDHAFRRLKVTDADAYNHGQRQGKMDFTGTLRHKLKHIKESRPEQDRRQVTRYREKYIDTYDKGTTIRLRKPRRRDYGHDIFT